MTMTTGVVQEVSKKEVNTKFGMKPTFSIKVNGAWVKCGFKNPNANVGDEVQFDGVSGTYGLETKAVIVLSKGTGGGVAAAAPTPTSTSRTAAAYSGGGRVFPIPPLHGDRSIIRQNALARATDLVVAGLGAKGFTVDDDLCSVIIRFARKFEAYTAGDLDMAEAMKDEEAEAKE